MPGGEYDQFDEVVRPYMFLPFIQVRACWHPCCCIEVWQFCCVAVASGDWGRGRCLLLCLDGAYCVSAVVIPLSRHQFPV